MKNSIKPKPNGSGKSALSNGRTTGLSPQTKQVLIGLLSRTQVAHRLGTCTHTVQRLTRRGLLPAIVFNKRLIRYSPEVVEQFIDAAIVGGGQ